MAEGDHEVVGFVVLVAIKHCRGEFIRNFEVVFGHEFVYKLGYITYASLKLGTYPFQEIAGELIEIGFSNQCTDTGAGADEQNTLLFQVKIELNYEGPAWWYLQVNYRQNGSNLKGEVMIS